MLPAPGPWGRTTAVRVTAGPEGGRTRLWGMRKVYGRPGAGSYRFSYGALVAASSSAGTWLFGRSRQLPTAASASRSCGR
ncbi:hypothetical protein GCM10010502_07060 [Kitasatospora aureofaciens]|uniref:Uncharacterized protein n=1 Tax=Kitasatospora aureofaciens TaxID=1894 RepID=A0A8H9HE11_KITAU|nr:hypothetical protein GCM10010502_07060 [Kitasatospora aureofaciens]